MKNYTELKNVLIDMIIFFDEFSNIEQKKLDAVMVNDVDALEKCLQEEFACSIKMKGLERKRLQELEKLGEDNESIKTVLEDPSNENEHELRDVYDKLQVKLEDFRENSKIIKKEIDIKMASIKILLDRLENYSTKGTYNRNAKVDKNNSTKFKSQKV